jgi:hypothetical protein
MLGELYHIALNLKRQGYETEGAHPDFGEPGLSTNSNFRLTLGDEGTIRRFDRPSQDELVGLWTLKKGNFKFFPAVRLPNPLLNVAIDDAVWAELKKPTVDMLRTQLDAHEDALQAVNLKAEREQADRITAWAHKETEVLRILHGFADSFMALTSDAKLFGAKLAQAWRNALSSNCDDKSLKDFQIFLCGSRKEPKNKPPQIEFKVQLILDYMPPGSVSGALYHPRVKRVVLECLEAEMVSKSATAEKANKEDADDLFASSSEPGDVLEGPFPDWSIKPVIGKPFKPYSKFSEAPCNARYHKANSHGFAISPKMARDLVAAGSALTMPEKRNKTWRALRNGKFEERNSKKIEATDALIAYPTFEWPALLSCVSIFGRLFADNTVNESKKTGEEEDENNDEDSEKSAEAFAQVAEPFCKALTEGASREELSRDYIRLLILRQISPGQVQLAYSATPTRGHFAEAVSGWMASERNLPPGLRLPLPSKKAKSGIRYYSPRLLFPEEAIRLFSHQWVRDGTESTRIQSPSVGEILDVFLRKEGVWLETAARLLETLLPRIESLIVGAGNILHRLDHEDPTPWLNFVPKTRDGKRDKGKPDPRYYLIQSISLVATLLHALNSQKGNYMNQSPFLLGKLLAIMDELHKCYCIDERKGDIPSMLIGNGLLGRAADSPEQALQDLCDRSRIYLGWAKTAQVREKTAEKNRIAIYSARKLLRLAEPIAESLHSETSLGLPLGSDAKAHLFLGYLSPVLGGPKDTSGSKEESNEVSPATDEVTN